MADSRKRRPVPPADLLKTLRDTVEDFGVSELASRTAASPGVIYNKINTHETAHHTPTLSDLVLWPQVMDDDAIPRAYARAVGGVFVSLRNVGKHSDDALLDLFLRHQKELGNFAQVVEKSLASGMVTPLAFAQIHKESMEAVAAMMELTLRLEGMRHGLG